MCKLIVAGGSQLQLRADMDVDIDQRDLVQQMAAGILGVPLPHRAHVMAHAVLLDDRLPLRAGVPGGQEP